MAQELSMVGVMVKDMARSLEFYRRLGLAIPADSENQPHVEVKMKSGLTFFLDNKLAHSTYDPNHQEATGDYRILLEFYLQHREEVDKKYKELTDYGYQAYRAPFETTFGLYFAMVNDPDGNTILLSGEK
ncbi:MAG TPA: VOC family protein [Chloroflexia bacterium]|nr:VOC family protein [Chloroflexia bacterium]